MRLRVPALAAGVVVGLASTISMLVPLPVLADDPTGPGPKIAFSAIGEVLPSVPIAPASRVRRLTSSTDTLPATVPWTKGRRIDVAEFLDLTRSRAFVVLHHGRIVEEWYDGPTGRRTKLASWSVAKSLVALLATQAIDEGRLTLATRVVDVLPWLEVTDPADGDRRYNTITVRDLLDMTSGIDAPESYETDAGDDPLSVTSLLNGTYVLLATPSLRHFATTHRDLVFAPGTRGEYISFNSQLLSMVVAEALGQDLVEAFTERLWRPAGAQFPATWNLDRPGGLAKGFCCLNATARDFARLGLLIAEAGTEASPISQRWLERAVTPRRHLIGGWPYSTNFWHVPGDDRGRALADASAIGVFGQYVYVNRATDTVIVKLSDHGIEQDEELTFRAMRSIARSWGQQR